MASFTNAGDPIPAMRVRLANYYAHYPKEKVYLLSDKQQYSPGETLWFSGYVTRQPKPSFASGILYVELFNDKGFVFCRAMRPVKNSSVYGDLVLPTTLGSRNFYIRAYTA